MKLPKNYLENLSLNKYREYLKLLPNMKQENTKAITMLIFTFVALAFLGIFAINPTITTIIQLDKQLDESQFVYEQLTTKINNLSSLQEQYATLTPALSVLYNAIPETAQVPTAIGQVQQLAATNNITIISLTTSPVSISDPKQPEGVKTHASFTFSLEATGTYANMIAFTSQLTTIDRIVTIESLSFFKDAQRDQLILGITGREYYKKL